MVLITGGSGFIGKQLADAFGKQAVTVGRGVVDENTHIQSDLTDTAHIEALIAQLKPYHIDQVVHAAGVTPWTKKPGYTQDMRMAECMAAVCLRLNVPLVYLSGWNVYDTRTPSPYDETSPTMPETDYGKSKQAVENFLSTQFPQGPLCILRLASVYGPGQLSPGLIPNLVTAALQNRRIVLEAATTRRSYLYIDDLCMTIKNLCSQSLDGHQVLNIGSSSSISVADIAAVIKEIMQEEDGVAISIESGAIHESPLTDNKLDITKAQRRGLLKKETPIKEGLRAYIQWRRHATIL